VVHADRDETIQAAVTPTLPKKKKKKKKKHKAPEMTDEAMERAQSFSTD